MNILAIDPGKHVLGYAVLNETGVVNAGLISTHIKSPDGLRWLDLGRRLSNALVGCEPFDILAVEKMQVYVRNGARGAADLIDLQAVAGACVMAVSSRLPSNVRILTPTAQEWKGQVPREVTLNRMLERYGKNLNVSWPKARHTQADVAAALALGEWAQQKS
mgnify:FL=1